MSARWRWWLIGTAAMLVTLLLVASIQSLHRAHSAAIRESARKEQSDRDEVALAERAQVAAALLSESLVNPTYFFDLQRIGEVLTGSMSREDVAYVLLLDREGRILHDGSADIARFGQRPDDALAERAFAATEPVTFATGTVVEATQPITLGDQRLATLRFALVRPNRTPPVLAEPAAWRWTDRALLAALAALWIGVLFFVDRALLRPRALLDDGILALARAHGRGAPTTDIGAAFSQVEHRLASVGDELREVERIDSLTGLPNRIALRQRINEAIQRAQHDDSREVALLFVDLDDFKRINDTLGHDVGDDILATLAHRLRDVMAEVPPDDGFIARFGGDEFVLLLHAQDARRRAGGLAEHLLHAVRAPLQIGDQTLHLSASIGITSFPEDASDATRLLQNGDIAMYLAKVQGRDCARYFSNRLTQVAEDRLAIEQDLRVALAQDELKLHFQPIVDLNDGTIHGAEALLRWQHPSRGWVPSALFVSIAEDVGMIGALGDFALRTACESAARWPRSGDHPLFVSVNVSVKQLRDPKFPTRVAEVLARSGLSPERLHLELTESSLLDNESTAIAALETLDQLGVKLWLDDFGTGFSGLNHLRRVPVSGVKIDRSFVADLLTDRHDAALTSAIITMAHALGITAVAEGVESPELAALLRQQGCPLAQGYWYGEPAHSERMVERLMAQRYAAQGGSAPIN